MAISRFQWETTTILAVALDFEVQTWALELYWVLVMVLSLVPAWMLKMVQRRVQEEETLASEAVGVLP